MARKVAICSCNVDDFHSPVGIGMHELYNRYGALLSVIEKTIAPNYQHFLAHPKVGMNGTITWHCDPFQETPRHLNELTGADRLKYDAILSATLNHYKSVIAREKSEYLEMALKFIDEKFVYCFDGKVVLGIWGMKANTNKNRISGEYTKDLYIVKPRIEIALNAGNLDAIQESDPPADPPSPATHEVPFITGDIQVTAQYEPAPQQDDKNSGAGEKKHKPVPVSYGYIGIMGLVVIIVYLLTIFYRYVFPPPSRNNHKDTIPTTIPTTTPTTTSKTLPRQPRVIIPIDSPHIGIGSDNAVNIVTNRLNVLLEGNASIDQFAEDFKLAYPPNEYQIIYYDTLIKSLQIEIPATQRDLVKQELPKKLNKYHVFIWDESLFENFLQLNDPALQNKSRSWHINACQVRNGWNITLGKPEILTAIIDEGFNLSHPELVGKIVNPYNVWNKSATIIPSAWDHGTRVAGVALATGNNGIGISGIAPNCSFMPVQVADSRGLMTITSVVEGILYAIYGGADVINISLGMSFTKRLVNYSGTAQRNLIQYHFKEEERLWKEVFRIADEHNSTIVIAAGNGNMLVGVDPLQRSSQAIVVAAVNKSKRPYSKTRFSNFGERSTVSAPGVNIYTTYGKKSYGYLSGTSAATAIVTGAVALLKSVNRNLGISDIKNILTSTGIQVAGHVGNMVQLGNALKKAELSGYPQTNIYKVQSNKSVNINKRT